MIIFSHVNKSFGDTKAVQDLSFQINKGRIVGIIGPDGSGKTTILEMLATVTLPDNGDIEICGYTLSNRRDIRNIIGYMPSYLAIYKDLTVKENLSFYANLYGVKLSDNIGTIQEVYTQLEPFQDRLVSALSGGMKQKLFLCCALIHSPQVLLLDEPTTGVDPVARKSFWNILSKLKETGVTIVVSTPYMDEARYCDEILLIQEGKCLGCAPLNKLIETFPKQLYELKSKDNYSLLKEIRKSSFVEIAYLSGDSIHAIFNKNIGKHISYDCTSIKSIPVGIEDIFIYNKIINHNGRNN